MKSRFLSSGKKSACKTRSFGIPKRLSRRDIVKGIGAATLTGLSGCGVKSFSAKRKSKLRIPTLTYESIGVKPIINCRDALTVLSGSLMPPEVKAAYDEGSKHYVNMYELIEAAGKKLAELSGAEWGCVTSGACASLFAGAAGCITRDDSKKIAKLPDTTDMKNEVLVPLNHQTGYDRFLMAAGAKMVGVKTIEEMEAKANDKTAFIFVMGRRLDGESGPSIPLEEMVRVGKKYDIPVMADAAAERPDNPNPYLTAGVDLVAYSGGKYLRGPQCTGLLLGRKDLVLAASRNISPYGSLGRTMKVGKEEIMAVLASLDLWVNGRDHEEEWIEWEAQFAYIVERIQHISTVETKIVGPQGRSNIVPNLHVTWDKSTVKISPADVQKQLLDGDPRIAVSGGSTNIIINPNTMEEGEEVPVTKALYGILSRAV